MICDDCSNYDIDKLVIKLVCYTYAFSLSKSSCDNLVNQSFRISGDGIAFLKVMPFGSVWIAPGQVD